MIMRLRRLAVFCDRLRTFGGTLSLWRFLPGLGEQGSLFDVCDSPPVRTVLHSFRELRKSTASRSSSSSSQPHKFESPTEPALRRWNESRSFEQLMPNCLTRNQGLDRRSPNRISYSFPCHCWLRWSITQHSKHIPSIPF